MNRSLFSAESFSTGDINSFNPTILLADAAPSITKGFTEIFGAPMHRIYCFAHVKTGKSGANQKAKRVKVLKYCLWKLRCSTF